MKRLFPVIAAFALTATTLHVSSATAAPGLSTLESDELEMSYSLVTTEFYKKVDPQTLLNGARDELIAYLKKNGVASPNVPQLHAVDDPTLNARALEREVSSVVSTYGGKLGSRALTYEAISGVLASVKDKYTTFLSPKEYAALNEGLDGGNFSGVGISIQVDDQSKLLRVNDVIAGGPRRKGRPPARRHHHRDRRQVDQRPDDRRRRQAVCAAKKARWSSSRSCARERQSHPST